MSMWVVRAGREAALFKQFEQGGYVAIGGPEIATISPATSQEDLEQLLSAALPDHKPGTVSSWAAQYHRFARDIGIDDEVLTYNLDEQMFLLGTIASEVELRPDLPLTWTRRTQWTHHVRREVLSESTRNTLGAIQSLFKLNERAAQEVRQRADLIVTKEGRTRIANDFWGACLEMLDAYPRRPMTLSADSEPVQLRRRIQSALGTLAGILVANSNWRAAASVGQGNWVAQPWCAVYDIRETTTAQRGTYPVIHFRMQGEPAISVGWGVSWSEFKSGSQQRAFEVAQSLSADDLANLGNRGFLIASTVNTPTLPDLDAEGVIAGKLVVRSALVGDTTELTEDLRQLLDTYKAWVERTTTPAPAPSPDIEVVPPPTNAYTLDWLAAETQLNAEFLQDLVEALTVRTPQIILAGPPGTSKTWLAQKLADYLTQGNTAHQNIVQFHPSYSYEEFVEGLRPTSVNGAIQFQPVPGHLLRMVAEVEKHTSRHVVILDEINRANLPRVLGELLYLFEYRDRPLDLQYSKGFRLPARLLFIGTMNTADRSIRSLDAALRRRFEIFECLPGPDVLTTYYQTRACAVPDLVEGFVALNDALAKRLDRHHTIGHAFFMAEEMTPQRLLKVWKYKVGPLVEDYFIDQSALLEEFAPVKFWPSLDALA